MTRTRRFVSGLSLGYVHQALTLLAGLAVTPFVFHHLGIRDYGLWLVAAQILLYFGLADFGVTALLPREIAFATGRAGGWRNADELPTLTMSAFRQILLQTPIVLLAGIAVVIFLPVDWLPLRWPLAVLLSGFAVLFPMRIFAASLQGLQDLAFLGRIQIYAAGLIPLLSACLAPTLGLYALAVAWIAGQTLIAGLSLRRLLKNFPGALRWHRNTRRRLKGGTWVTLSQIAQGLITASDILIVAKLLGPAASVPYAFTGKLIGCLTNQGSLMMHFAGPGLSEMRTGESRERQLHACNAMTQAILMLSGGLACLVLALNRPFVSWWTGPDQFSGYTLSALLAAGMLLRHWNGTLVYANFCFGGEKRLAITTLADGLVTAGTAVGLIRFIGPVGAPIASLIGVIMISLPANLALLATSTNTQVSRLLVPLGNWFVRFIPLAFTSAWIGMQVGQLGFWLLGLCGIAIGIVYTVVMAPAALRGSLGLYLKPRITRVLTFVAAPSRS